jgi:WD40 repeat protein
MDVNPAGARVATGGEDSLVRIYDTSSRTLLSTLGTIQWAPMLVSPHSTTASTAAPGVPPVSIGCVHVNCVRAGSRMEGAVGAEQSSSSGHSSHVVRPSTQPAAYMLLVRRALLLLLTPRLVLVCFFFFQYALRWCDEHTLLSGGWDNIVRASHQTPPPPSATSRPCRTH